MFGTNETSRRFHFMKKQKRGVDRSNVCLFVCLFGLRLYVPVNNVLVMSGRSHRFLVITSTFGKVNVSCLRLRSPTLYH